MGSAMSDDSLQQELATLYAETMALQILFVTFCSAIVASGTASTAAAVVETFDKAADILTAMQMRLGDIADVRHTGGAVRIVEELRTAVFEAR